MNQWHYGMMVPVVDRKKGALIILVIIFASVINYLSFYNSFQTHFHYENTLPDTWMAGSNIPLYCNNLQDTNVTIIFQNDRTLWYAIDITLYNPSYQSLAFGLRTLRFGLLEINGIQRIKSIKIVLGTGAYHDIFLNGRNLNASITYSNGVILGNSTNKDSAGSFYFSASGKLYFTLNEDVDCFEGGLDVFVGSRSSDETSLYPDDVYLDIDVPDALSGSLRVYDPTALYFLENVGWYFEGNFTDSKSGDTYHRYDTYNPDSSHQPYYLNLREVRAGAVYAQLKT